MQKNAYKGVILSVYVNFGTTEMVGVVSELILGMDHSQLVDIRLDQKTVWSLLLK